MGRAHLVTKPQPAPQPLKVRPGDIIQDNGDGTTNGRLALVTRDGIYWLTAGADEAGRLVNGMQGIPLGGVLSHSAYGGFVHFTGTIEVK